MWVDLGEIWRVISMESASLFSPDVVDLAIGHEVGTFNSVQWVKLALLLNHELVDGVDEDEAVMSC